jgi:ADP-ribose diphosphatase
MPKNARRLQKARGGKSKPGVVSSVEVFRGPVFRVTTDQVVEPGGIRARRDIVRHPGSVVILAVEEGHAQPRILLERQYRHAAKSYMWELPAGRIDKGESELRAAKRELLEETGYTARRWQRILKFYASPGFIDETMAVYLATGLRAGVAQPEADELIQLKLVPMPDALRMVTRGDIHDAKTISSVFWLAQKRPGKPRR